MSASGRGDRRRRIAERSSDRLAFITGKIQTLPPSPPPAETHHSHTASCPPVIAPDHGQLLDHPIASTDDHKASRSLARQTACVGEIGESVAVNDKDDGNVAEPVLRKCETSTEASRVPSQEVERGEQSSDTAPAVQEESSKPTPVRDNQVKPKVQRNQRQKIFTSNKIGSAIAASATIRAYCSVAAAVLVVLSNVGFPILGSRIIKSTIFFRPLYLVLTTNVSIVVARLLLCKEKGSEKPKQEASNGEANNASPDGFVGQVGKALETGLLLQNIMGSIFVDFSIYAIIVICGVSMAKTVGW